MIGLHFQINHKIKEWKFILGENVKTSRERFD
jgi:hypothetical protein